MSKSFDEEKRNKIMGLGKNSIRKNYYRSLLEKQKALEEKNRALTLEIEKREEVENKLLQLNNELEQRIERRTRDLEKSNSQLKETIQNLEKSYDYLIEGEKIASLNYLVNGIAHELGTPLGVSLTSSTYIHDLIGKARRKFMDQKLTKKDLFDLFKNIDESSTVLEDSIENLTKITDNFKRISLVQNNYKRHKFSPYEYTNMIFDSMKSQINSFQKIEVDNQCDPYTFLVGDPGMYTQLLTIFIENSLIHGFDKHGGMISVDLELGKDNYKINYKDNGQGMEEALVSRVFEPFFTSQMSKERNGLGLFAAYNMVKGHGGAIKCHAILGQGFEIEVVVPLDHVTG